MAKGKDFEQERTEEHSAEAWNGAGDEYLLEGKEEAALECYTYAANMGHVDAMYSVSNSYFEKEDLLNAVLWAHRAAVFGHEEARDFLGEEFDPSWHDEFVDTIRAAAAAESGAAGPGGSRDVERKESDGEAGANNFYELADFVQALIAKNRENVKRFGESFLSHFESAEEAIVVIRQYQFPSDMDPLERVGYLRHLRNLANDYFRDDPAPSASPSPLHTPVPSATVAAEVGGGELIERQHLVVMPSPSAMPSPSLAALNVGIEEVHPSLEELEASARSGFMGALSFVLGGSH